MTLRVSAPLLLGVARIYSRKGILDTLMIVKYLLEDCNEALAALKLVEMHYNTCYFIGF